MRYFESLQRDLRRGGRLERTSTGRTTIRISVSIPVSTSFRCPSSCLVIVMDDIIIFAFIAKSSITGVTEETAVEPLLIRRVEALGAVFVPSYRGEKL
jgi:hypothetical protein